MGVWLARSPCAEDGFRPLHLLDRAPVRRERGPQRLLVVVQLGVFGRVGGWVGVSVGGGGGVSAVAAGGDLIRKQRGFKAEAGAGRSTGPGVGEGAARRGGAPRGVWPDLPVALAPGTSGRAHLDQNPARQLWVCHDYEHLAASIHLHAGVRAVRVSARAAWSGPGARRQGTAATKTRSRAPRIAGRPRRAPAAPGAAVRVPRRLCTTRARPAASTAGPLARRAGQARTRCCIIRPPTRRAAGAAGRACRTLNRRP